jgi:hypothetical protein
VDVIEVIELDEDDSSDDAGSEVAVSNEENSDKDAAND